MGMDRIEQFLRAGLRSWSVASVVVAASAIALLASPSATRLGLLLAAWVWCTFAAAIRFQLRRDAVGSTLRWIVVIAFAFTTLAGWARVRIVDAPDSRWEESALGRMDAVAEQTAQRLQSLRRIAEERASAALDPGADLARLSEPIEFSGSSLPVGVSVWLPGQILRWSGGVPGPERVGSSGLPLLVDHGYRRYLTVRVDAPDGRSAYCDVGLGVVRELFDRVRMGIRPGQRLGADPAVATRILPEPPVLAESEGVDVPVRLLGVPRDRPWAWVEVQAPRPVEEERRAIREASRRVALGLLVGLFGMALVGWRAWSGRRVDRHASLHTVLGLLAAVGLRLGLERARALELAFESAPSPFDLLLDPTYFASTALGGVARSTADFLLTGLLVAVAAVMLLPVWLKALDRARRPVPRLLGWTGLVVASAALVTGLQAMQRIVASNANPTLIGLDSPFFTLPFVSLHLAMVLGLLLPASWVVLGWERWFRGGNLLVGLGGAVVVLAVRELQVGADPAVAIWGPLLPLLGAAIGPSLASRAFSRRAFAGLLAVLWFAGAQSQGLERVYTSMKEQVAVQEAEQRLRPLDNWRRFLLEELLREISEDRQQLHALADADADRSNAAFEIWAQTVLPSHEFGSRIELRDDEGRLLSEFDIGLPYEPAPLRQWRQSVPMGGQPYRVDAVELATEQGPFLVYRGRLDLNWLVPEGDASQFTIDLPYATPDGVIPLDQTRTLGQQILGLEPEGRVPPRRTFDRAVFTGRIGERRVETASNPVLVGLRLDEVPAPGTWETLRIEGEPYHVGQVRMDEEALLVAFTEPTTVERLLDLSRLAALYLALCAVGLLVLGLLRLVRVTPGERWPSLLGGVGFQERLLGSMLVVVLLPVFLLGVLQERRAAESEREDNLVEVGERLDIALQLLASNLDDLAGALIGGEYVQQVLFEGDTSAPREVGPYELTQMMIFDPRGALVLDETLSDLDDERAREWLELVRDGELVLESDERHGWFLGRAYPVLGPEDRTHQVYVRRLLTDEDLGRIARTVQADLTVYDGPWAVVSSQAYLYKSGLREPVLSSVALPVLEGGSRRVVDAERQGGLLVANGWAVLPGPRQPQRGILSVRLLTRATESARERQRAQLFVFGLSSLAMVLAVGVGLFFSGRIVGPIRELVDATARVGRGDLDRRVRETGSDEIGHLVRSFNRMTDQLRDSQRELAARRVFLEAMLDSLRSGVVVLDSSGEVLEANEAATRLLGPQREVFLERLEEHHRGAALVDVEIVLARADGPRTLRTVVTPTQLQDGRHGHLVVFDDVSELLASRRLALYAQMARQVAHEVKNPLTPIQLSAQMVRQASRDAHPRLPEIVEENVGQIEAQVERLRNIASEFSLLGRESLDDLGTLELEPLLQEVRSLYPSLDGGWTIEVEAEPGLRVWASREALTKVLTNLVENARQAMAERGTVRIRAHEEADRVRIGIEDEGPGIDPEVESRLFEPYFSTKSTGTGLGLVICRNLMEKMGGRIGITNRPDADGAVAELDLAPASSPRDPSAAPSGGNDSSSPA